MKIFILIPIYNDWQSLEKLLEKINNTISNSNFEFSVIIVNDSSSEKQSLKANNLNNLKSIKIINIKNNMGHGRCNAIGLKYIFENEKFDYVIPMDGDGEDRPEEIKQFINKIDKSLIIPIVGERVKRSEGPLFVFCYYIHKILTLAFTGRSIKFGNYTCLPKSIVEILINEKATWSSFSGSLTKISHNKLVIPSIRGGRYFGPSKMSFKNLLVHSLAIIGVFKFNVLFRSILFAIIYILAVIQNVSLITLIPLIALIIFVLSCFIISSREKLNELKNSLSNITNIDNVK
jgi:hypothetical protein|tara:strand:+ start:584 stop:1453 length:870 start_codon:yes stop_codon:yes gene_type:complete